MKFILALLGVVSAAAPSAAHDRWADGSPGPAWVKQSCCGPDDAHLLTMDMVHRVGSSWKIDGYPNLIPDADILPSQDGRPWIFYKETAPGVFTDAYCVFLPLFY